MATLAEEAERLRQRDAARAEAAAMRAEEVDAFGRRLRGLIEEARAARIEPHPMPFASTMAEQHPYRTDFLSSWQPQYAKTQKMWEQDQRRAKVLEGVRGLVASSPDYIRRGLLMPDKGVIEGLRSPTASAGLMPPWSGGGRFLGVFAGLGSMAAGAGTEINRQIDRYAGRPDIRPHHAAQVANAADKAGFGVGSAIMHAATGDNAWAPSHIRQYQDWVKQQEGKPLDDLATEYMPSGKMMDYDAPTLFGEAFPDAPLWLKQAGATGISVLTDPFAPYAGVPRAMLPRAVAKDVLFGSGQDAALFPVVYGMSEAANDPAFEEAASWLR